MIAGEDSALMVSGFANGGAAMIDANRYKENEVEQSCYTFCALCLEGSEGHLELSNKGSIALANLSEPSLCAS